MKEDRGSDQDMTERTVKIVQPTRQMHTLAPLSMHTRRKAACYLRISTASDEQENSLENQRQHYLDLLQNSPDLEFAGKPSRIVNAEN